MSRSSLAEVADEIAGSGSEYSSDDHEDFEDLDDDEVSGESQIA